MFFYNGEDGNTNNYKYLHNHPGIFTVAVVALVPHSVRVGRYLEHYRAMFPAHVNFINAAVPLSHNNTRITVREVTKIQNYAEAGELAANSIYTKSQT